ncbi:MAG: LPS assembly lipoprotein LptE [Marinicellaceae bacterium]
MNKIVILILLFTLASCGYHLRANNAIAENHPNIKLEVSSQSTLKRPLVNALLSSNVKLTEKSSASTSDLVILKDALNKVIQSIGANNQVQEYRLEYDVEYRIGDSEIQSIRLEKDYSFDIQQIGGGQSEERALRKELAEDMAWAIIRQINIINTSTNK